MLCCLVVENETDYLDPKVRQEQKVCQVLPAHARERIICYCETKNLHVHLNLKQRPLIVPDELRPCAH